MYQKTTATSKVFSLAKRTRGVSGGTSASKTISILFWIIQYAQTKNNRVISIVSESLPHLKRGAIRDFLQIMKTQGYYDDRCWNKTDSTYVFPHTNSTLEFFGADAQKLKGARRTCLFVNEANNISYEAYTQLETRTNGVVWLDWNPDREFWWYTEVLPHNDVDFLTLTYKDNEALSKTIVESIESRKHNKAWWQVYGLGQLGEVEGRIYTGWNTIDQVPEDARLEGYGLDFGYSNDPTAIVAVYYLNNRFILDEITYRKGLLNSEIANILKAQKRALCVADSAEPKSIAEIASYGVPIIGASKGAGSVLQGIQYVQGQQIDVTKRSVNILKEYRNYLWETDKDGKTLNVPPGFLDHTLSAIRYIIQKLVGDRETKKKQLPKDLSGEAILNQLLEEDYELY
jgi:phage terminase large subunit